MVRPEDVSTAKGMPRASSGVAREWSLLIFSREHAQLVRLTPGAPVVIGRSAPADVTIADASVSRLHARFTLTDSGVCVEDLGSTNGTQLAGAPIERSSAQSGDVVTLGDVQVAVHQLVIAAALPGLVAYEHFRKRLPEELERALLLASARGRAPHGCRSWRRVSRRPALAVRIRVAAQRRRGHALQRQRDRRAVTGDK